MEKLKRSLTCGFDIGTNGIAVAVIEELRNSSNTETNKKIIFGTVLHTGNILNENKSETPTQIRTKDRSARKNKDRKKSKKKHLSNFLKGFGIPIVSANTFDKNPYIIRAKAISETISLEEFGIAMMSLSERIGFKSSALVNSKDEEEVGKIKTAITQFKQNMQDAGFVTPGQLFASYYNQDTRRPNISVNRIRHEGNHVGREDYMNEFDLIVEKQKHILSHIKNIDSFIKNMKEIIYFQRPLKSQKHLVKNCTFEPSAKVCHKSHIVFQEYRIRDYINNLEIISSSRDTTRLTREEKEKLFNYLNNSKSCTLRELKKFLGIDYKAKINFDSSSFDNGDDKVPTGTTNYYFNTALGQEYVDKMSSEERNSLYEKLLHIHYSNFDHEWSKKHVEKKFNLSKEQSSDIINSFTKLERDYSNLSIVAIKRILPHLKATNTTYQALVDTGYRSPKKVSQSDTPYLDRQLLEFLPSLKENEIRNPVVRKVLSECIKVFNELIKKYGKFDRVVVELAREIKKSQKSRDIETQFISYRTKTKECFKNYLDSNGYLSHKNNLEKFLYWTELPTQEEWDNKGYEKIKNIFKGKEFTPEYIQYIAKPRYDAYEHTLLTFERVFGKNSDISIEHIVPQTNFGSNESYNKTLATTYFNNKKGTYLPCQCLSENWKTFSQKVKYFFPKEKRRMFLLEEITDNFKNHQLCDTSYAAREFKNRLEKVTKRVLVVNGQHTSLMRKHWNVGEKDRSSHLHHLEDAVMIASMNYNMLQAIHRNMQVDESGTSDESNGFKINVWNENDKKALSTPWNSFNDDLKSLLDNTFVFHKNNAKLLSTSTNRIEKVNSKTGKKEIVIQKTKSVRAKMFNANIFSIKKYIYRDKRHEYGAEYSVKNKQIGSFDKWSQIEKVWDPTDYLLIKEKFAICAAQQGIGPKDKTDKKVDFKKFIENNPIHKNGNVVRSVMTIDAERKTRDGGDNFVRSKDNNWFKSEENYYLCIYEDSQNKKRIYEIIPFFVAAQRKQKKELIFSPEKGPYKLLYAFKKDDMYLITDKKVEEVNWDDKDFLSKNLYRVAKFDVTGGMSFAHHSFAGNVGKVKPPLKKSFTYKGFNGIKVSVDRLGSLKTVSFKEENYVHKFEKESIVEKIIKKEEKSLVV